MIVIHDIDEKRWGVDALSQVQDYLIRLEGKNLTVKSDLNTKFNLEMTDFMKAVDGFRDSVSTTFVDISNSCKDVSQISKILNKSSVDINLALVEYANTYDEALLHARFT